MRRLGVAAVLWLCACPAPPVIGGDGGGSGGSNGGGSDGGATGGGSGGGSASDAGPVSPWQWLPVAGSQCGSGSTAGIGVNAGSSTELFIFMQGGGACWNQGTCVPSLLQYGPLCDYSPNICIVDAAGGTQPTATHVTERDPFPGDGGGYWPSERSQLNSVKALDREAADNPFRDATFVYVPYCTGDLHSGRAEKVYAYSYTFGMTANFTVHFNGAANMDLYLARLVAMFPNVTRIWLTGASAGGYGATLNYDRVARAFPAAEVHLLADSSPFITTSHFTTWRDLWAMEFPTGCTACVDGGFPEVVEHLSAAYPTRRIGLLSNDQDKIIRWFFYAGNGAAMFVTPPLGPFTTELAALEGRYDTHTNTRYFVVPGESHVLWGEYGTRLSDGGYTAPRKSRDGGSDLKTWIDAWADGGAAWQSLR